MKIYYLISTILLLSLAFCHGFAQQGERQVVTTTIVSSNDVIDMMPERVLSPAFELTVENGYGSGMYESGDTVHIWAEANPPEMVFDVWSGDAELLVRSREYHTTLVMPEQDVTVTAMYAEAPDWFATQGQRNGTTYYYHFPENHKGVITLFHGSGGFAASWTQTKVENRLFAEYAVANGYAILAVESMDRQQRQWSLADGSNEDIDNIRGVLDTLEQLGLLRPNEHLFAVGMSQGGVFGGVIAEVMSDRYVAAALYCIPGQSGVYDVTTVPTIWNMAGNDVAADADRVGKAFANFRKLEDRSIPARFNVNGSSPVFPERFTRIPGMTEEMSRAIHDSLGANGFLDERGYFTVNPLVAMEWQQILESFLAGFRPHIIDQVVICYAEHKFFTDFNHETISFFDTYLGVTSVDDPVVADVADFGLRTVPNPSNAGTMVRFNLPESGHVQLHVYDPIGGVVAELAAGRYEAGEHQVFFRTDYLPSGTYYYRLVAGERAESRRLNVVR